MADLADRLRRLHEYYVSRPGGDTAMHAAARLLPEIAEAVAVLEIAAHQPCAKVAGAEKLINGCIGCASRHALIALRAKVAP